MRKKTDTKRNAILRVAHEVFCEKGYEKASMNEIAARLGGSKATLYGYFPSKKHLLQEVMSVAGSKNSDEIASYLDQYVRIIPEGHRSQIEAVFTEAENSSKDVRTILSDFGERIMMLICLPEFQELYRLAVEQAGRTRMPSLFYEAGPRVGEKRIAALLEGFMQRGLLRKSDPQRGAVQLIALLKAELFEPSLFCHETESDPASFREKIRTAVESFLMIYQQK